MHVDLDAALLAGWQTRVSRVEYVRESRKAVYYDTGTRSFTSSNPFRTM